MDRSSVLEEEEEEEEEGAEYLAARGAFQGAGGKPGQITQVLEEV